MEYKAKGVSRRKIYNAVMLMKQKLGLDKKLYFPVVYFAENILPMFYKDYVFEVVEKDEMKNKNGETFPNLNTIRIREDVYDGAVRGNGRDRFTVAHEIGHLLMHRDEFISMCQLNDGAILPPYENPEWQANCFAGELLASSCLIKDMDEIEIAEKCGISKEAARIQLQHIGKVLK